MYVKNLIAILSKCNPEDEISFVFDASKGLSRDRGDNLFETYNVNVTGHKINGYIALTNGASAKLLNGDEELIY